MIHIKVMESLGINGKLVTVKRLCQGINEIKIID